MLSLNFLFRYLFILDARVIISRALFYHSSFPIWDKSTSGPAYPLIFIPVDSFHQRQIFVIVY